MRWQLATVDRTSWTMCSIPYDIDWNVATNSFTLAKKPTPLARSSGGNTNPTRGNASGDLGV